MMDWREIPGHPGYRIARDGSIWSDVSYKRLKQHQDRVGRKTVWLRNRYKGPRGRTHLVHHLVLETFVGSCPEGMEACHNNGDPSDNRLENLRWDTRSANHKDKVRHGRCLLSGSRIPRPCGEKHHKAKLRSLDVRWIRYLRKAGVAVKDLAEFYCVSQVSIRYICDRTTWKSV